MYNSTETTCVCAHETRGPKRYCFCRVGIPLEVSYCSVDLLSKNLSGGFSYNMRKLKPPLRSRREKRRFTIVQKKKNQMQNKIIQTNDARFEWREGEREVLNLGVWSYRTVFRRNTIEKWG